MIGKRTTGCLAFLVFGIGNLNAQATTLGAGGEASGAGGTMSYSVGQVVYTSKSDGVYTISEGVQQPYEISETLGMEHTDIELSLQVFPNPASDFLTLVSERPNLRYQLVDSKGAVIRDAQLTETSQVINLQDLEIAIYFLHVMDGNETMKSFKIIKN
jgi:hypothetical protein